MKNFGEPSKFTGSNEEVAEIANIYSNDSLLREDLLLTQKGANIEDNATYARRLVSDLLFDKYISADQAEDFDSRILRIERDLKNEQ